MTDETTVSSSNTLEVSRFLAARPRLRREMAFILPGLLAGFMAYYATSWGPWAFSDATGYIVAARNLRAGHGLGAFSPSGEFSPGVSHPPLYVLCLTLIGLLGSEPLVAARIMDVALFAILVSGVGLLFYVITRSFWLGVSLSVLLMLHPAVVLAYLSAMSDPLFLLLCLGALLFLALYIERNRARTFYISAGLAGLALLTRYPGAALVLSSAMVIILFSPNQLRGRARSAAAYSAIGFAPISAFLAWAAMVPNAEGPRALRGHFEIVGPLLSFGQKLTKAIWTWKPVPPAVLLPDWLADIEVPQALAWLVFSVLGLGLTALAVMTARMLPKAPRIIERSSPAVAIIKVFTVFVIAYLAFFIAAFLVTDPTPDVNSRTMLPLLPALMGILLAGCAILDQTWSGNRWVSRIIVTGMLAAVAGYALISQDIVLGLHRTGLGYTGREWRQSETMAAIQDLPPDVPIITNEPAAVMLLTGRTPYTIFEIAQREPVGVFSSFGKGTGEADRVFREEGAALVLFDTIHEELRRLYGDQAETRFASLIEGLYRSFNGLDGGIYWSRAQ